MSTRLCKYDCGKELTWDTKNSRFIEADGTPHTKERCASLKAKPAPTSNLPSPNKEPAKVPAMKQVHAIIDLSPPQYEVLRALCEASDSTEAEYIRDYLLDIMRSQLDIYFSDHATYDEMKRKLELGA